MEAKSSKRKMLKQAKMNQLIIGLQVKKKLAIRTERKNKDELI